MAEPNGWPDPSRPGVPMNPEQSGAHAVSVCGRTAVMFWRPPFWFGDMQDGPMKPHNAARKVRYLGPCLTPAEVAARVEQARAKALEEAAGVAQTQATEWAQGGKYEASAAADVVAAAIRALKEQSDAG